MNDHYLGLPPATKQSEEDIRAVVAAVRKGRTSDGDKEKDDTAARN
jgi:hypothetical protein